ncbi:Uncharacterised protein [Yersinia rohdei]|nr:Uncharacterised protein [Yersinia rohdei]
MRPLTVIFIQPALRYFPCFTQCSEQMKIQYFCPVRPVKTFDKRVLRRLTRLDKFQHHTMVFSPLRYMRVDQDRSLFYYPARYSQQQLHPLQS